MEGQGFVKVKHDIARGHEFDRLLTGEVQATTINYSLMDSVNICCVTCDWVFAEKTKHDGHVSAVPFACFRERAVQIAPHADYRFEQAARSTVGKKSLRGPPGAH